MKRYLFALFILFQSFPAFSQNQGLSNIWLMGYQSYAGLPFGNTRFDFMSGNLSLNYDSISMNFRHTLGAISDTNGQLLFYTNGYYIADASNDTMQNGSGINPGAYANYVPDGFLLPQGALILPKPDSPNLYYMFHNTADQYPNGSISYHMYYTIIDMNLNGGLGGVVSKNNAIINDSLEAGKIVACKHGNGRDWWIVFQRTNSNKYYKLLLTNQGVFLRPFQTIGPVRPHGSGQVKFSNDGTKFSYFYFNNGLDIFDFDRCTGLFSNPIHDDSIPQGYGGVEFSPNSQLLYVCNGLQTWQYNLQDTNIISSKQIVAQWDTFYSPQPPLATYLSLPMLAQDGKIYITTGNSTLVMHVINYPDSLGLACDLVQHGITLPAYYFNTLPNYPNFFLGALTGSACDTLVGVGINEPPPEIKISAFPNPATDKITFWFPVENDSGELKIYDVLGNEVLQDPIAPWSQYKTVDVTRLNSGIYFCRMKWRGRIGEVKIILSTNYEK